MSREIVISSKSIIFFSFNLSAKIENFSSVALENPDKIWKHVKVLLRNQSSTEV